MADRMMDISGLDVLAADMEKAMKACPDETEKAMQRMSNLWKRDCNAKMPSYYKSGSKSSLKRWRTKTAYGAYGYLEEIEIRNRAPHFHLVENGHRKYDFHGNPTGGFVAGKHFAERTRAEWTAKYPRELESAIKTVLAKVNL